ncbi:hypothetical protein KRR38_14900 [Novosphingobium sp. G106]|uniref:hypothetical protein n=1 Tax=Novosphingobium sp. G106 TaxID=2849500 RepID=UPI001C2D9E3A|nr:hypothetical protein [Novosphingobium sp. G106]MBV1688924.1 hypothetical protein [Novosphingobium sp. G106]
MPIRHEEFCHLDKPVTGLAPPDPPLPLEADGSGVYPSDASWIAAAVTTLAG